MSKTRSLKLNAFFSIFNKIAVMLSGIILPRLILQFYGSEINGLVASITQFLSVITFLDLGVGAVVQTALYRPLAQKDNLKISKVLTAAKTYFRRIAYILLVYILFLMIYFPRIITNNNLNIFSTVILIISISIGTFAQYYFGIINEILLNADQKAYIQLILEIVVIVLNLLVSIILIYLNFPIYIVKLASSAVFLIRVVYLNYYVEKNYNLSKEVELLEDPLPQKWNGVAQHIAYSVQNSTDIIVLTTMSTLENVSVYSVYNMIASAIQLLLQSLTTGLQSFFGSFIAREEYEELKNYFKKIEWMIHTGAVFLFGVSSVLISPFVMLYTGGVTDVNYYVPIFSSLLLVSRAIYSIRTPYQSLVFAAGHYKQTQFGSVVEAIINVILSFILVYRLGLVGVAIGSLIAIIFRTLYLVYYLSNNIILRAPLIFVKLVLTDSIQFILIWGIGNQLITHFQIQTFTVWIGFAIVLSLVSLIIIIVTNLIFYKTMMCSLFIKIKSK